MNRILKRRARIFYLFFFLCIIFVLPSILFAQGLNLPLVPEKCNQLICGFNELLELIRRVTSFLIFLTVLLAVAAIAYAGFLYLTSGGDTGKISRAHSIFMTAGFGIMIAVGAWVIVNAVAGSFLNENFLQSQFWFLKNI